MVNETMEKYTLRMFFFELLDASYEDLRAGWGNPCSWLLKQMCLRQDELLARIQGDYTNHSHEWRLNDAGLKLYWRVDKEKLTFRCSIGGDQAKEYPFFVAKARRIIEKYKMAKRYGH